MLLHARSFLALAALLALPLHDAAAHPRLLKATPAADSRSSVAPTEIVLTFNEPLTLALSRITLTDATQRPIALDSLRNGHDDPKTLLAKVTGVLAPGRYTVKWQAAGADGHPMRGELTFVVDPTAPSGAGAAQQTTGRSDALAVAAPPSAGRRSRSVS